MDDMRTSGAPTRVLLAAYRDLDDARRRMAAALDYEPDSDRTSAASSADTEAGSTASPPTETSWSTW